MKNINIPEPCSEDWSKMTPSDKGAFCKKCALDVYDFTNKSSDEIRDILTVNIGSRVCGHINKTQLDELNFDFSAWQVNDKQSFQRAWVFTLFVVFGMSLFSCQAQEKPVVEQIHKIGKIAFIETEPADTLDVEIETGQICIPEDIGTHNVDDIESPLDFKPILKGQMIYQDTVTNVEKEQVPIDLPVEDQNVLIDGGLVSSISFEAYLVDTIREQSSSEEFIVSPQISGFVYPNPTSNQTTFHLNMPKRGKGEIVLFTLSGQKIRTIHSGRLKKGESEFPLDLTKLTTGMYLVIVSSGKMKETVKFMKI